MTSEGPTITSNEFNTAEYPTSARRDPMNKRNTMAYGT